MRLALPGGGAESLGLELHKLNLKGGTLEIQPRYGHWQLKPARARTAWINIQDAVSFELAWLMRMPANDHAEASRRRIQVKSMQVVQHVEQYVACRCNCRFRQRFGPLRRVHISAHRNDRGEFSQSRQNLRLTDIPGMKNQVRSTKGFQGLRAQQPMSIRDQADSRRRRLHKEILRGELLLGKKEQQEDYSVNALITQRLWSAKPGEGASCRE